MRVNSKWLTISMGALALLVVLNSLLADHNLRTIRDNAALISDANQALAALEATISNVKDAETGQRGYLLTRNNSYLGPYQAALAKVDQNRAGLIQLFAGDPTLSDRLTRLHSLVSAKMEELARTVELGKQGDFDTARQIVLTDEGKRTMDQIRALVNVLQDHERGLLAERQEQDRQASSLARVSIVAACVAGVAALIGFAWLLRRHLQALHRSAVAIHAQKELLRATLSSIGDGMIVTDVHTNVTYLNAVAQNLTGWSLTDAMNVPLATVFRIVNEASRQEVESPAIRALREGRIVGLANHTILIAKSGAEWPIDDSAAPITDENGIVSGAVLVFREISERKQHEALMLEHTSALQAANRRMNELLLELQAGEEQFHTMVDSIPQLAWMARPDGSIYWYNKRWYDYTGATVEQMQGHGWQTALAPEESAEVTASWQQSLASGEPWEHTFRLLRHDGELRWHLSRAVPVHNERGEITRWFGTNTDITERREMEESLREVDRRKDEFLATLAHELRNPIAPISNALQVWPLVENDPAELEQLRGIMERQIKQMIRLVDDLLDVSRITRGKIELRRQTVDLATIVSGAVEAMRPLIDSCGHQLELELPPAPVSVDGDVARLTQALGNLLQNAAKYTGHGGKIRVFVRREGSDAVVSVEDNGPGIPSHMLTSIFDMFQQVDQTLDRAHGGLGLGLSLVKRMINLHGGTVEATSGGAGQGSQFTIRLPALDLAVQPTNHPPSVRQSTPRKRCVLVVDDVQASAKTLAMMLQGLGQEVTIANDGLAALSQVESLQPEVMFLDIAMPGMNGYEVARRVRNTTPGRKLMLVALTGYGHDEDRRLAIEAGFDHHLTKPTSIEQLAQLLNTSSGHVSP